VFNGALQCGNRWRILLAILLAPVAWAGPAEEYKESIRPILESRCFECHGTEKQKGDLNLATFSDFDAVKAAPEVWQLILERVQAFEMPPKKSGELPFDQHQKLVNWLRDLPQPEKPDCDQVASDRTANFYRGYVMSRRLNREEYLNTLRDLFEVTIPAGEWLPADGGGGEGFDTTGSALFLSPIHIERYLDAAEKTLAMVLPDHGRGLSPERRAARRRLLVARPGPELEARVAARLVIENFARRAFRGPVSAGDVDRFLGLFDRGWDRGDGYVPSLRLALAGILVSPQFLFLAEPEPATGGVHPLAAVPLASKLSYFLWSSMPDDRLLDLAESGQLLDTNIYRAEIHRMLKDDRARALGERFALQWLDLERLGGEVKPDPERFPEFTPELAHSMRQEVVDYFNHLVREDRSLLELIDSDYTLIGARLAQLYGIEGITGEESRQVTLAGHQRGGLLGMAAIHVVTSFPTRTSPVLHGRWVLEALLGDKIPPPPPGTPPLEETPSGISAATVRQQLEIHRARAECASCHDKMDPLGFGLENFDALGRWRDGEPGAPIDARGIMPSGESFEGPVGLKSVLMARKAKFLHHLTTKMTGFAFGRELNKFDACVVDRAVEALEANGYRASVLVESIAMSYPFRHRFYPKQDS
jgi:mono/diheme cytochrome c family protein